MNYLQLAAYLTILVLAIITVVQYFKKTPNNSSSYCEEVEHSSDYDFGHTDSFN
jgi:hypothetical protein